MVGGFVRELFGPIEATNMGASYEETVRKLGQISTRTVLPVLNTQRGSHTDILASNGKYS